MCLYAQLCPASLLTALTIGFSALPCRLALQAVIQGNRDSTDGDAGSGCAEYDANGESASLRLLTTCQLPCQLNYVKYGLAGEMKRLWLVSDHHTV